MYSFVYSGSMFGSEVEDVRDQREEDDKEVDKFMTSAKSRVKEKEKTREVK